MIYKAVLFDLDGTLIHTKPEYRYLLVGENVLEGEFGITDYSKADIDRFWFELNRNEIIKECFCLEPELFWKAYKKHDKMDLRRKHVEPYNDVDIIPKLKQRGYKTGIVTGAPEHVVELEIGVLEKTIGEENFDAIVSATRLGETKPKPSPDGLIRCIELLGVEKDKVLFVGNSSEDSEASENAGIPYVHVDRGEHKFTNINAILTTKSLYGLREPLGLQKQ